MSMPRLTVCASCGAPPTAGPDALVTIAELNEALRIAQSLACPGLPCAQIRWRMSHWYPDDEAWKGTYDDWKTTDPRDLEPEEPRAEEDPDDARDWAIDDKYLDKTFGVIDDDIEF